jgi:hypothetical protein
VCCTCSSPQQARNAEQYTTAARAGRILLLVLVLLVLFLHQLLLRLLLLHIAPGAS